MNDDERKQILFVLCKEVLDVQDACNLSGVVHAFSDAIRDLRKVLESEANFSTEKLNHHPVSVMWASKIGSLTVVDNAAHFASSYGFCDDIVKKGIEDGRMKGEWQ